MKTLNALVNLKKELHAELIKNDDFRGWEAGFIYKETMMKLTYIIVNGKKIPVITKPKRAA